MTAPRQNLRKTADLPAVEGCGCFGCQLCYPDEPDLETALGGTQPANVQTDAETPETRRARLLAAQDALAAGI